MFANHAREIDDYNVCLGIVIFWGVVVTSTNPCFQVNLY